jgi:hypothetical protein
MAVRFTISNTASSLASFGVDNWLGDMLKETDTNKNNENAMALFSGQQICNDSPN